MHEVKEKARKLCALKDEILDYASSSIKCDQMDVDTAGKVVDMVKDLCEAEKDLYKAKYYCTAAEGMLGELDDDGSEDRMGYDNWRTPSGRFAPKGSGNYRPNQAGPHTRSGYPWPAEGDWRPEFDKGHMMDGRDPGRMGYSDPDYEKVMRDERHGRAYKDWKMARRHYTETKSDGDRQEMSEHAKEHVADTIMTIKEIWQDADPALRTKMKADLTTLVNEMK